MPETKKYLNRDGLEEYNSLLPHSSTEIQEYVDDWLDTHPEATTTVPDDGITTRKLANGSVTRNKLAADVAHLLGGMMVTGEVQGEILSADDAYSVAPLSMEIDGKSTQDGTPTPDAPVPIQSIEVLELPVMFVGKNLIGVSAGVTYTYNSITLTSTDGAVIVSTDNSSNLTRTFLLNLVNGTISGGADLYPINYTISESNSIPLPAGTYRFTNTGTTSNGVRVGLVHGHIGDRKDPAYAATFTTDGTERAMLLCYVNSRASLYTAGPQTIQYQLEVGSVSTAYEPYTGITANIPMQGHVLRSLPDGTHDTLALSYLRTSTREGWAWYSMELVQMAGVIVGDNLVKYNASNGFFAYMASAARALSTRCRCSWTNQSESFNSSNMTKECVQFPTPSSDTIYVAALADRSLDDFEFDYPLATPITTTLDPIELPVLPAPNCTVWSDPSTGLKMSYMRDANIVVSNIEQAIADL